MIRLLAPIALLGTGLCLSACDAGPYTPSAHRASASSTGSMLQGVDTGAGADQGDPSIRSSGGASTTH